MKLNEVWDGVTSAPHTFDVLAALVARLRCKPGWHFALVNEDGALRLRILTVCEDAYSPGTTMRLAHLFPVPTATYNEKSWRRWIFERCLAVENHEMGEWFRDGDERPFAPLHAPGEDPYVVHEFRDESDARATQDGNMRVSGNSQERAPC